MLQGLHATTLQSRDGILIVNHSALSIYELLLVLFKITETTDYNQVDNAKSAKLLELIDHPDESKRAEN